MPPGTGRAPAAPGTGRPVMPSNPASLPVLPARFADGRFELLDHRARRGAADFKLRVARGSELASPQLVSAVEAARPTLREHVCTADDTGNPVTLPHLIEHVAIDLLVERRGEGAEPVAGYTKWLDKRAGLARVTLSSDDDGATCGAMLAACALVAQYSEDV